MLRRDVGRYTCYNASMKGPFVGMDPHLERFWNDVHGKLVTYSADESNEQLPPRYRVAMWARGMLGTDRNSRNIS